MFSLRILQTAGFEASIATIYAFGISIIQIIVSLAAMRSLEYFGLRKCYLTSSIVAFIGVVGFFILNFFIENNESVAISALVFMGIWVCSSHFGMMPVPHMLPSLWLPTEFRQISQALIALVGLAINFGLNLSLPKILYEIDNFTFLIFIASIGLAFMFAYFKLN